MTNSEAFMERVGFLLETGERLSCLLNPESIEIRRRAGVQPRRSVGGILTGRGLTDDPLLYTGGGSTEFKLDLLFDVSVAGSSLQTEDVRHLTLPLWRLAENAVGEDGYGRLPIVRFVWGRAGMFPASWPQSRSDSNILRPQARLSVPGCGCAFFEWKNPPPRAPIPVNSLHNLRSSCRCRRKSRLRRCARTR